MKRLDRSEAATALFDGEVIAVPTDTVYGVAARWSDAEGVARLFSVKSRPLDVALPVLVGSLEQVMAMDVRWPASAGALAAVFWPGALTIVVGAERAVATRIGATDSLGLRWPRHDLLEDLIIECGPLAVTSANEHGEPPCTSVEDVSAVAWGARVAGVLDGGRCDAPVSSVVEVHARGWRLRRLGAVGRAEIGAVLGPESEADDD